MMIHKRAALAALLASTAGAAMAQQATPYDLGTITIDAAKRPQESFRYSGSVGSVDAQDLGARNVQNTSDLDRVFPGVTIDTRSARAYSNITVRGQSSVDFYNPSVQLYMDGLPQDAGSLAQAFPIGVDRVELLYGPQGTLYGRGAIGGVLAVTTLKPGEGPQFGFAADMSDSGGYRAAVQGQVALADGVWADLALTQGYEANSYEVIGTGADIGRSRESHARLRFRYAPQSSPLDLTLSFSKSRIDSEEEQYVPEPFLSQKRAVPITSHYVQDSTQVGVTVDYDLDWGTFTSITSWQDRSLDRTIFGSYTPEWQETFSQEFRLSSAPDGIVDYVAGLSYTQRDFTRRIPAFGIASFHDIANTAAFGDLTWHVNERFDLTAGLRYDYEKARVRAEAGPLRTPNSDSWNALSYKLAASYEATPDLNVYGLITTGFKAGGFTRNLTPASISFPYDPQETLNVETGLRYFSPDGRVQAQVAAYWNVTDDYQMFVGPQPFQFLQNVGEVTAKGVDATIRYSGDDWSIRAGVGWNDTTFTRYNNPFAPGTDLTGNQVPYAPRVTANLALDRRFELSDGATVTPRLGLTYQSETFFEDTNTVGQDDFVLVDAGVNWQLANGLSIDLYGTNLTDETYATYGFESGPPNGALYQTGPGRTIGLNISKSF